jgi:hypothetical protein
MEQRPGLDPFTRRYLLLLLGVAAGLLIWWLASFDSRVGELNRLLRSDNRLAEYPYRFQVLSLNDGVAEISSPRSAQVPVMQFLRIVYPELKYASVNDEAMMTAQDKLAKMQAHAGKLVSNQEYVQSVRWSIDRQWYANHGIYLD